MLPVNVERYEEMAIAALLGHRYGDGMIHVQTRDDRILLKKAAGLGLVDAAGYLTPSGRRFCASWRPPGRSRAP